MQVPERTGYRGYVGRRSGYTGQVDYDGDQTNFMVAPDQYMAKLFYPFSAFFNLLLLDKPFEVSKNASMSDPVIASISEWLNRSMMENGLTD